ncbi:MAG: LLM class flavin-dependent oxidoreductase [Thermodesulfobacteriota bacterium]|jgi:alkanesulfonate monooxygenase SsuD/methylene tetrahydromethanopterin reductase-like flavin-dependent oxidoreductase (luciferase family)
MATTLKFGYLLGFRNPPGSPLDFGTLYAELFRQVEYADQAGFDSVWLTEHHFTDDGYLAAVMPTLAAVAARTRRVSIGTYVLLAPLYHPLRLAEDTATIDVISGGRLRLGIGLGYRGEEFAGFQIPRPQRLGRTLETVEILKRAWTGERFSFAGRYFQFRDVRVLPRPISQPHPELLWGGMTPAAIRRGAELDLSFACNLGQREVALYRETLQKLGKDPAAYSIVNSRTVYVADTAEQAWADIEPAALYQAALYAKWLADATGGAQRWIQPVPEQIRRTCILGPPEEVGRRLAELGGTGQMTELILNMQLPGLDPAKAMRSLERFATEVLPALRR